MIGIIVVTHGALGSELIAVAEHVVGKQQGVISVPIGPDDDIEARRNEIITKVKEADTGNGVAILTDMFGGTPSNLAISVMERRRRSATSCCRMEPCRWRCSASIKSVTARGEDLAGRALHPTTSCSTSRTRLPRAARWRKARLIFTASRGT